MTKKGFEEFPKEIIKEVLLFLKPGELFLLAMQLNKKFNRMAKDSVILGQSFFNYIKVPFDYGGASFLELCSEERISLIRTVLERKCPCEKISMLPFYTDGGVDGGTSTYFLQNIFVEKPNTLYCSVRGENVNVKFLVSDSIKDKIDLQNINKYKIPKKYRDFYAFPDFTYKYPIRSLISAHEPYFHKQFAIIKFYDINRNFTNYTCLLQSFVVFVSMEEIDVNHPLVKLFDNIKKIDQVDKLGFEYKILQETIETKVVEFNLQSLSKVKDTLRKHVPGAQLNGIYPLLWGDVCKNKSNYLNLTQLVGFRHMLVKLIDSHKTHENGNIDCYTMSLSGNLITLKYTYEE